MPTSLQYEPMLFSYWVRILTNRLEPEGVWLYEVYQVEQHLNQSGIRHHMPSLKIRTRTGDLVGLMNGESELVKYDDNGPPAPNLPPLREESFYE